MASRDTKATPRFAVVIPMYNEEVGAEDCVRKVCAALARISPDARLITVEDGGKDNTLAILKRLATELPQLVLVVHEGNKGYGAGLKTGAAKALDLGFEYVLFMDSDLTNDPADISRFAEKMAEGHDVIKATRYSHGGRMDGVPFKRQMISRVGNMVARALFRLPVTDCTNGFRAVRTSILSRMDLRENNFSIIMEELYHCKQLTHSFANVPVVLTDRAAHLRGTSFRYKPSIFYDYLKYPVLSLIPSGLRRTRYAPTAQGD